jgi:hypothetical protein
MAICPECHIEMLDKDFFGKEVCYRCIYKVKMQNQENGKFCRICRSKINSSRWVYCSTKCSNIGELKMKKDYWSLKIKSVRY